MQRARRRESAYTSTGGIMDPERLNSDQEASPSKSKRSKHPISDGNGTVPTRGAPSRKRTRRASIEDDGKLKRAKPAKLTPTVASARWKKTEGPVVSSVDAPASKSLATKLPTENPNKRPRRSTPDCTVSTTSESPKRRGHSQSHHHQGKSDGFVLDSRRDLCAQLHSARPSRGDRKRTMSRTSAGSHTEETSPKHRRSRSCSPATTTHTRRKVKRQQRAAQHAMAAAKGCPSRKRAVRQATLGCGEPERKIRRTNSRKDANNSSSTSRHRGRSARVRRRRPISSPVTVRDRPCCGRLRRVLRRWE
ncbi:hypothetical protein HPB50_007586 [Hyalomma asiaticum]|uniref:Uncharacterized protein n=1 Tax=Hyalomma asiaticum TaxID=266040 RepID=A0ACB7TEH7_HYAAI|nr:hypothetical protein HPB50_007586 [Hyalomma asiaticum]